MNPSSNDDNAARWHRSLLFAASGFTFVLITLGGLVCVTQSARGCPDWPGCFGQPIPPAQTAAVIEYFHRLVAALTSPLILVAAFIGWRKFWSVRWLSRPPVLAIPFLIAVIIFGMLAVTRGIPSSVSAVDLGSALIVLALILIATIVAFSRRANPDLPDRLAFTTPFSKLTLWAVGAVFVVTVSSVLVADAGSTSRCLGWPLYNEPTALVSLSDWYKVTRHLIAGIAGLLIVALVVQAWRTRRSQKGTMRATAALGILFVVEIAAGLLIVSVTDAVALRELYAAIAAAIWASVVVLAVQVGISDAATAEERVVKMRATKSAV